MEAIVPSSPGRGQQRSPLGSGAEEGETAFTDGAAGATTVVLDVITKRVQAEASERDAAIARLWTFVEEAPYAGSSEIPSRVDGSVSLQLGLEDVRKHIHRLTDMQSQQEERLRSLSHNLDQVSLAQASADRDQKATFRELSNSVSDLGCKFGSRMACLDKDLRRLQEEMTEVRELNSLPVAAPADSKPLVQRSPLMPPKSLEQQLSHAMAIGAELRTSLAADKVASGASKQASPVLSETGGRDGLQRDESKQRLPSPGPGRPFRPAEGSDMQPQSSKSSIPQGGSASASALHQVQQLTRGGSMFLSHHGSSEQPRLASSSSWAHLRQSPSTGPTGPFQRLQPWSLDGSQGDHLPAGPHSARGQGSPFWKQSDVSMSPRLMLGSGAVLGGPPPSAAQACSGPPLSARLPPRAVGHGQMQVRPIRLSHPWPPPQV
eukprot:TRINITY_DN51072_c0_g1_i2.p1 TRINITY_DN51072_c0_g1~~TRINITY_DN51072_c0_g1_i2.p1  ORF type:complete len:434 (+),score=69.51 TRINITY_DN51072_c0_g1_i2:68-1369(+)